MTWTCPNCGAAFEDEQTMKDHATMTCQRGDIPRVDVSGRFRGLATSALGPEIAGGRDANQGAPRPPVPPSEPQ